MNAQLQAQISQILAQIMTSVGEVKDFSVQQLPDIAQQYISYGFWVSIFWIVLGVIGAVVGGWFFVWSLKRILRTENDGYIPVIVCSSAVGLVSTIAFFDNIHNLILVTTAPKVWFILEIKEMLSS
jgi:hypothetical protein